ncbi:MAG: hypothetical protein ACRYFS_25835 [Janthinobacterium lividum]
MTASLSIIVFGSIVWVGVNTFHGISVVMSDRTSFEYDHNLPRAYEYKTTRNLKILQVALVEYAQRHKGYMPPMDNPAVTIRALQPFLEHDVRWRFLNPATGIPFVPNVFLSNKNLSDLPYHGRSIVFYDANPPLGYRESYYITIEGVVSHVPLIALPKLLVTGKNEAA